MSLGLRRIAQSAGLSALIVFGILHSAWATRLDSSTSDKPWHIVAGVSYLREGSLRLNPEHPLLVKLWVVPWVLADSFRFTVSAASDVRTVTPFRNPAME